MSTSTYGGFQAFKMNLIYVFQKISEGREPHRQDLTEQQSVDGVDSSVYGSADGSKKHVGPLRYVVLEDPGDWSRLHGLFLLLLWDGILSIHTQTHRFQQAVKPFICVCY